MKEQIKNHILNALLWVPPGLDAILRDGWVDIDDLYGLGLTVDEVHAIGRELVTTGFIDGPRTFCLMEARAQMYVDLGYSSKLGVG